MAITDRAICTEEGVFTYNGVAGGTFEAGDALELGADGKVYKGAGVGLPFIGVAVYGAVEDDDVAFYGPGNIVWGNQGTTGVDVGDYVKVDTDGGFTVGTIDNKVGLCLVKESTTYCKILTY